MKQLQKYLPIFLMVLVLGIAFLYTLFSQSREKQDVAEEEKIVDERQAWRIEINDNDLDLLARVVHSEARGEPYEGQVAIAAVIINRIQHPEFPNTVSGVVYEPLAFSVVADGQVNKPANDIAIQAAHDALNGFDPTGGAVYFYNPAKTSNAWIRSRPVLKTIGRHVFST